MLIYAHKGWGCPVFGVPTTPTLELNATQSHILNLIIGSNSGLIMKHLQNYPNYFTKHLDSFGKLQLVVSPTRTRVNTVSLNSSFYSYPRLVELIAGYWASLSRYPFVIMLLHTNLAQIIEGVVI